MRGCLVWLAMFSLGAVTASSALAQDLQSRDDGYFVGKLMLGFGGEADIEADNLGGVGGQDDMETSYGLGFGYLQPLHEYFALGGQLALLAWTTDGLEDIDADRSTWLDLSVVPQAKYAVMKSLELYASLPLGLTVDFFGEDEFAGAEVGGGLGFNIALMFGARYALSDAFGFVGEIGYSYHAFSHELEIPITGTGIERKRKASGR